MKEDGNQIEMIKMKKIKVKHYLRRTKKKIVPVRKHSRKLKNRGSKKGKSNEELIREMKIREQQNTWLDFLGEGKNFSALSDRNMKTFFNNMSPIDREKYENWEDWRDNKLKKSRLAYPYIALSKNPKLFELVSSHDKSGKSIEPYVRSKPLLNEPELFDMWRRTDNFQGLRLASEGRLISDRNKFFKRKLKEKKKEIDKYKL